MLLIALWSGCAPTEPAPAVSEPSALEPLEPAQLARRLSLDLRGKVPSLDELEAVESGDLDGFLDGVLADPQHEERLVDLFAEQWLTRIDEFNVPAADFHYDDATYLWLRSIGDEPLRLLAHVGANDLPWTDVVNADYTMANDVLFEIFPLEPVDADDDATWRKARYTDDRPAGGVLMTNGLWWKYDSTLNNYNRGRAAALSKLLLCHDFLERPVEFSGVDEFTTEALMAATRTNPSCMSCHSSLDPLAATLFGFWWFDDKDALEMRQYHPEREPLGQTYLDLAPTWFGTPMNSTASMGAFAAADPRFVRCAVERVAKGLWRREIESADHDALNALEDAFYAGDLRLSALIRAAIATDEYQAGALVEGAEDEGAMTRRLLTPDQLADAVEDLTGYRWTFQDWDQLENDTHGYRVITGGVDADQVTRLSLSPSVTRTMVVRRLAQLAAAAVVEDDFAADPTARRLFSDQTEDLSGLEPGSAAFTEELTHLRRRVHGVSPTADQLAEDEALWSAVQAASDNQTAWRSVISVLLRDPLFWSY